MKRIYLGVAVWLIASASALAADDDKTAADGASVLVTTQTPAQGTLDQPVTAFGTAQPQSSGASAIAALHAAQIVDLRVVQGQPVDKGDVLLALAPEPATALAYQQARSDLDLAAAELARTRRMVEQKLATGSQLDQAAKTLRDAEAKMRAREREGGGKAAEPLLAPYGGIVTNVAVSNGDHVQPGTTLLDLARSDREVALVGIAPALRQLLKRDQTAELVDLDFLDAPMKAKVVTVGAMVDVKTGLVPVIVAPAAEDAVRLPPGAHVRVTIDAEPLAGWIVPRDAVLSDDDGPYLFQVSDGKAVRVGVAIAGESGDQLAVQGKLDPARQIVVSGNYQLSDGGAVRAVGDDAKAVPAKARDKAQ